MDLRRPRPPTAEQRQNRKHLKIAAVILCLATVHSFVEASRLKYCYLAITATLLVCLGSSRAFPYLVSSLAISIGLLLEISHIILSSFAYQPHIVIECIIRFMHMALLYLTLRACLDEYQAKRSSEEERMELIDT